ncbi:YceI family protein [soil metagenome]
MSTWRIDPAHTDVLFSAKHMMVTTVRGKFDTVEGELELDEEDPTSSHGEIRVAVSSLSTGIQRRDDHLRSGDFLDVEHHPTIVVRVTDIQPEGDRYRVTTDLTIRGLTRPLVLDAEFLGIYPGMQGGRRVGFTLSGTIARKVWGLDWNVALEAGGWLVGEEVKVEIEVAADEVVEPTAA